MLWIKTVVHKCDKAHRDRGVTPSDECGRRFKVSPGSKGLMMRHYGTHVGVKIHVLSA